MNRRSYLERCQHLSTLDCRIDITVGVVVARGFADLGFEEYQVVPGPKIISLCTGNCKELPAEEKKNFFVVPTVDFIVTKLGKDGWDIEKIVFDEQRVWRMEIQSEDRCLNSFGPTLIETFLEALILTGENEN